MEMFSVEEKKTCEIIRLTRMNEDLFERIANLEHAQKYDDALINSLRIDHDKLKKEVAALIFENQKLREK